ncbi:molybdopterin-dependent oxidoreductase [Spirosoma utsteinense]|uniref:Anaerobic selenocysteine-containing dehydrogenase n=1 Tax=Spirosoma utsteinense TaxID=2585773 RepID=A0ABR6WAT2_9BACT|nr:molybdopterin-dependent oxidoreductase [Spirosoma utsteinense]MBC3785794.1 anaerobic selenocysteine-containing dehydrogenase [Spirosoma utsteinense]MBC3793679.1 anaerobic selenocysteine-containing dehydrogenase [Spirosoma utsteinense]
MKTHYRACNLCEAICGLVITYRHGAAGTEIISIKGDPDDPFSRGHICPKAVALKDIYEDPNRLKRPLKRFIAEDGTDDWQEIGWEEAFDEVADRLRQIRSSYGANVIGVYAGNPSVHNSGTFLTAPGFIKALGTRNVFSASSVDQFPHHFAAWQLFGHPLLLPVPDIDRTDFWLIIGGNPIASNGSIMTAPDVANRLKAIRQRGGRVVVIDPRRTETATRADQHQFIRPGTDVYLLLAMIQFLFAEGLVRLGRLATVTHEVDSLRAAVADFTPDVAASMTGIPADIIRQLTRDFAGADRAACYGRVGVSVQTFGGLCLWAINVINLLTGNLDEPGGMMFTTPAIDVLGPAKPYRRYDRYRSRVTNRPEFMGELPVSCLAAEILTESADPDWSRIRAMVTSCGNPVLSTPNGCQLEEALGQLDFMVSVDIYLNETTRHADYILPPATGLETAHYDLTFHALAIRNTSRYSVPMIDKGPDARYDWEIFEALRFRLESDTYDPATAPAPQDPAVQLDKGLRYGSYGMNNGNPAGGGLSVQTLLEHPHGIDLGPLQSQLPDRLMTETKRINLLPVSFQQDLHRVRAALTAPNRVGDELLLISRRHLRDNNSWLHNTHRLVKGPNRCTLQVNSGDARRLGIGQGQLVEVRSRVGRVVLPAEITDDMMPGVVCMPHGYGHHRSGTRLDVAQKHAGVSINDLTDELRLDELTGNASLSGVPVTVQAVLT